MVAIRKANLLLNRHTATNSTLLHSSSSSTRDSLLSSLNMVNTSKDLLSQTSIRVPVCYRIHALAFSVDSLTNLQVVAVLPLLLQPLNSSAMALPIATTSDTQTAPAGEKPF